MARRGECAAAIAAIEQSRQLFPDDRKLPHVLSRLLATCDVEAVAGTPAKSHRGAASVHGEEAKRAYRAEKVAERISAADLRFVNERLDARLMRKFGYSIVE